MDSHQTHSYIYDNSLFKTLKLASSRQWKNHLPGLEIVHGTCMIFFGGGGGGHTLRSIVVIQKEYPKKKAIIRTMKFYI